MTPLILVDLVGTRIFMLPMYECDTVFTGAGFEFQVEFHSFLNLYFISSFRLTFPSFSCFSKLYSITFEFGCDVTLCIVNL